MIGKRGGGELGNMIQIVSKQFPESFSGGGVFFKAIYCVCVFLLLLMLLLSFVLDARRVFHSFLFLPLVAKPHSHHVLFQIQLLRDRGDFLRGRPRLNGKVGLQ